jgi:hypothetical protein
VRRAVGRVVAVSREFRSLARELRAGVEPRPSVARRVADRVLRYLPELLTGMAVLWLWLASVRAIGPLWTVGLWALVTALLFRWSRSRRWLLTGLGLAVTRFRLRTALVELRLTNRAGRLPLVLWMVATPVGERVWLWCRAGISAEDMSDEVDGIRAACCAREVRISRDSRWAALVLVDVIRRDPLASTTIISSPLVGAPERGRWRRG